MNKRVNRDFQKDMRKFGTATVDACMNCGNCTAVCSLTEGNTVFPRKFIRYMQLGLEDKMAQSPEPWLCYYCGDCSDTCPREADPGEIMMSARRYLISKYDWTGLSRKMYISKAWEFGLLLSVALIVFLLFYFLHGPIVTERVELNTFAPVEWVEFGDIIMLLVLSTFLLSNAFRMYKFIMNGSGVMKVSLSLHVKEIKTLIIHGLTQMRWRACEKSTHWLKHFLLVTAYGTMFLLIVVFLRWFQTDEILPIWHPTRLLGYYATIILLYVTADAMIGRWKKREAIHKNSHISDWVFLILLFLTVLTGILVHIVRLSGLPLTTYYLYVIHMMIAVPMLVIEVPFSKWSHMLYRPLAIYLTRLRSAQDAVDEMRGREGQPELHAP